MRKFINELPILPSPYFLPHRLLLLLGPEEIVLGPGRLHTGGLQVRAFLEPCSGRSEDDPDLASHRVLIRLKRLLVRLPVRACRVGVDAPRLLASSHVTPFLQLDGDRVVHALRADLMVLEDGGDVLGVSLSGREVLDRQEEGWASCVPSSVTLCA